MTASDVDVGLPARRAALAALQEVDEAGAWSNLAVPAAIAVLDDERDRAFAAHLAYDTLRWQGTLDWALATALRRRLADVEPALRRVLRLGALQLLRTSVPARAAVATAVTLAKEQVPSPRSGGAGGFVNGVLRTLSRGVASLPWPDAERDPVAHLVLRTAHPAWVVTDLVDRYGHDRAEAVLDADNRPPGVTLRAVGARDALVAELGAAGVDAAPGRLPESVSAPGADPGRLAAVAEGRAVPQDEASMRVVHATGAAPDDRVLDLCAGPGGKATHLAARVGPDGRVVAVERYPHRAELVRVAARRQGLTIDVVAADATELPFAAGVGFDRVLVDAPCTGLGTGRRRPEIRWRRTPAEAGELAALQRRLLAVATDRLRPGGTLTYAVCTWTTEETDAVAAWLDRAHGHDLDAGARVQLLPDDGTDGMYVATWRRR